MSTSSLPTTSINSAPYSSVLKFYHINQFYHWMNTLQRIPTSYYYFSLVPYPCRMADSQGRVHSFFANLGTEKISSLQKAVQGINMPRIQYQSIAGSAATIEAGNITGAWQMVGNTIMGTDAQTFTLQLLNTSDPIIETIIYPWYIECVTAIATGDYPFPRVDFAVNFFAPNQITQNMENISPMFTYYIMGAFPTAIQAFSPNMQFAAQTNMNRDVTFAFNNMVIVNSHTASNYKLDFIFNKDAKIFPEKATDDAAGNKTPGQTTAASAQEQAAQRAQTAGQTSTTTSQASTPISQSSREPASKLNWNAFDNLMGGAARYAVSQASAKSSSSSTPSSAPSTRTTSESSYSAPQITANSGTSTALAQDLASGTMSSSVYGELKTYAGLTGQDMDTVLKEYTGAAGENRLNLANKIVSTNTLGKDTLTRMSDISQEELGYSHEKENSMADLYKMSQQTINANQKAQEKASLSKSQALDKMKEINGLSKVAKPQQRVTSNDIPASFLKDSFLSKSDIDSLKSMMKNG